MSIRKEAMKITNELIEKIKIPKIAWSYDTIDNDACYVIKNAIYCKVFWLSFWHEFAEKFKSQKIITHIENVDLSMPVIINERLELKMIQPIIENVNYFSQITTVPPFKCNLSMNMIFFIYLILCVILLLLYNKERLLII